MPSGQLLAGIASGFQQSQEDHAHCGRIFGRLISATGDVAILRRIFRQLEWYAIHGRQKEKAGFYLLI